MSNRITLGSKVTFDFNGHVQKYQIVQSTITNPCLNHLSYHSPLGRALLGRSCGDKFLVKGHGIEIKEIK